MILTRVPRGCHDSSRRSQDGMTPNITFSIFYIKAIPLAVQYTTLRMGWLYIWILLCHACTSFARRYCAMATPPWHEAYNYTWGEENKWLESSEAFIASTWQCRQIAFPIARFLGSGVLQARGERGGGGAPLEGDRGRASGVKRGGWGKSEIHLTTGSSIFNQIFCNTRGNIYVASITTMRVIYDTGVREHLP